MKYLVRLLGLILTLLALMQVALPGVYAIDSIGGYDDTVWYSFPDGAGYDSFSVDMTPEIWNGGTDGYYYSLALGFTGNVNGSYGGLQANGNDGNGHILSKSAIFSIWDVDTAISEPGGYAVPFGGEGDGYSVRIPYNWSVGTTYRFKIYIDQDAASGNRLWGASVTNLSSGQVTRVGRIYAPVTYGKLKAPVTFHERFTGATANCTQINASQVRFINLSANNGAISASSWNHYVTKTIPECPGIGWTQEVGGGYVSGVATTQVSAPASSTPQSTSPSQPTASSPSANTQATPAANQPSASKQAAAAEASIAQAAAQKTAAKTTSNAAKTSGLPMKIIVPAVGGTALLASACFGLVRFRMLKHRRMLAHHFPHDYDIHGPRDLSNKY